MKIVTFKKLLFSWFIYTIVMAVAVPTVYTYIDSTLAYVMLAVLSVAFLVMTLGLMVLGVVEQFITGLREPDKPIQVK